MTRFRSRRLSCATALALAAVLSACAGGRTAGLSGAARLTAGPVPPQEQMMKVTMIPTIREVTLLSGVTHGAREQVVVRKGEPYALRVKVSGTAGLEGLAWVETTSGERLAATPLRYDRDAGTYAADLAVTPPAAGSFDVRAVLQRQGEDVTDIVTAVDPLRIAFGGLPEDLTAAVGSFRVLFETDEFRLDETDLVAAGEIAARLAPLAADIRSIRVEGHCDPRGDEAHNLDLGRQRAASLARVLAERLGQVPIGIHSLGSEDPQPPGDTPEDWARNRWARIVIEAR